MVAADFEKNDCVECIDDINAGIMLKKGDKYIVEDVQNDMLYLTTVRGGYFKRRFQFISGTRGKTEPTKLSNLADLNVGKKDDNDKLRYDLITPMALEELAKAVTDGAKKYGDENWRKLDNLKGRYYAAAERHMQKWRLGQKNAEDSGIHHLGHAMACLMFLLEDDVT